MRLTGGFEEFSVLKGLLHANDKKRWTVDRAAKEWPTGSIGERPPLEQQLSPEKTPSEVPVEERGRSRKLEEQDAGEGSPSKKARREIVPE